MVNKKLATIQSLDADSDNAAVQNTDTHAEIENEWVQENSACASAVFKYKNS